MTLHTATKSGVSALISLAVSCLLLAGVSSQAHANTKDKNLYTLINLERERAALIAVFLNNDIEMSKKHELLTFKQRQLADVERMVLRDERLLSSSSSVVKRAFNDYDMTFLVHAGAEDELSAMGKWLKNANITNQGIMATKAGYR
ncbi:hypothetical protein ISG33_06575 [Glaciecola sp. MH2013]|uniref:hypothetical protein n=1 Tax=Glaciecola sp. MH2013 TaxID=2785524 RepID=UPI00189DE67C|nr:hypothetical protein [Glaciecola sp. MH2013]MBF7073061.1 hypothetical protein [Glaciecola sp. MH2013]